MFVSEIFKSFQGEGINAGNPAVFLRLGGCNFRCKWCDTKYSWEKGRKMEVSEVLGVIMDLDESEGELCKRLVITGGEPLLQAKEIAALLEILKDWAVEIETNGSVGTLERFVSYGGSLCINCSPKLKNSGVKEYDLKILPAKNVYYKFVVCGEEDVPEIKKYIKKWIIPRSRCFLMPEGKTKADVLMREKFVKRICIDEGYNYCARLQILKSFR